MINPSDNYSSLDWEEQAKTLQKNNEELAFSWNLLKEYSSLQDAKIFFLNAILSEIRRRCDLPDYMKYAIDEYDSI